MTDESQERLYLGSELGRVWRWYFLEAGEIFGRLRISDFVEASFDHYVEVPLRTVWSRWLSRLRLREVSSVLPLP